MPAAAKEKPPTRIPPVPRASPRVDDSARERRKTRDIAFAAITANFRVSCHLVSRNACRAEDRVARENETLDRKGSSEAE